MTFTIKDIRKISNDIELLQSAKKYMPASTAFKLGLMSQLETEVKTGSGRTVYLNEEALMVFKRLVELVAKHSSHREIVTKNDIYAACKSSLEYSHENSHAAALESNHLFAS